MSVTSVAGSRSTQTFRISVISFLAMPMGRCNRDTANSPARLEKIAGEDRAGIVRGVEVETHA